VLLTNRAGRFTIAGVGPGRYQIRLSEGLPIALEVPKGCAPVGSVGVLRQPSTAKTVAAWATSLPPR
jgi:hypothetical protein